MAATGVLSHPTLQDKSKATEYKSADDFHDAMTLHDRKVPHGRHTPLHAADH